MSPLVNLRVSWVGSGIRENGSVLNSHPKVQGYEPLRRNLVRTWEGLDLSVPESPSQSSLHYRKPEPPTAEATPLSLHFWEASEGCPKKCLSLCVASQEPNSQETVFVGQRLELESWLFH